MTDRFARAALLLSLWMAVASPYRAAVGADGSEELTLLADGRAMGSLSPAALVALPRQEVTVPVDAARGVPARRYGGPTLWSVLERAGSAGNPHDAARRVVVLRGRDGYGAAIAGGGIAPAFENKAVILAVTTDGGAPDPEHLRAVVPGDAKAGHAVRDVVAVEVDTVASARSGHMPPR